MQLVEIFFLRYVRLMKLSGLTLTYTYVFTEIKVVTASDSPAIGFSFLLTLCNRRKVALFRLMPQMFAVLSKPNIFLTGLYNYYWRLSNECLKLSGILKNNFLLLAGYAISFKKRFYLSGQVNRLKKISKTILILQLGYSHKIRIRALRFLKFRWWRRKKFGISIKANSSNKFSAFIDLFRHLRLRAKYTSRGIRLRKDRFKMKFRPDHGKYGFKMNY